MRRNSGFTLIELMITVGIVGVLAATAIPTFSKYKENARDAEANMVLGTMLHGMKAYYNEEWVVDASLTAQSVTHCFPSAGAAPQNVNGGGELNAMIPNAANGEKQFIDFGANPGFAQIGMAGSGFYYHTYVLGGGSGCSNTALPRYTYLAPLIAIRIDKFYGSADTARFSLATLQLYDVDGEISSSGGVAWFKEMALGDFVPALVSMFSGVAH